MANISKIRVGGVDYDIKDQSAGAGTITAVQANGTNVATSGTANIPAASTSAYGVTKLSSATNSTSTALAATASAVKSAYDLANGKQDKLTSGTNIKTINGESLLGSGDITIEAGGGSSDSGPKVVTITSSNTTQDLALEDNTIYIFTNRVTNLTLLLYYSLPKGCWIRFMNNPNFKLTLSGYSSLYWANGVRPTLEDYYPVEISINSISNTASSFNIIMTQFKTV